MRGDSGGTGCVEEYGDSATAWSKYDIEVIKSEALWLRNKSSFIGATNGSSGEFFSFEASASCGNHSSRCGNGNDMPAALTASYTAAARSLLTSAAWLKWLGHTLSSKLVELAP